MTTRMRTVLLATLFALPACAAENEPAEGVAVDTAGQAPMPMGEMPGMAGMVGMQSVAMMQQMQTHMQAMTGASADSMHALMPAHRQMTANLIAQMNQEMRQMNMRGDPAWEATVDSLRQDLTRLPEMTPEEMEALLPAHQSRIRRVMDMHREMMAEMPM